MVPRNVSKATFLDHLFHIQVSLVFSTERHPNSRGDSTCQSQQLSQSAAAGFIMIGILEVWLENKTVGMGLLCSLPYSNAINTREREWKLFNLIELGSFFIGHFLSLLLRLKVKRIYLILIYSLIFFFFAAALQGEGKWSSQNKTTPVGLRDRHGGGHRLCFAVLSSHIIIPFSSLLQTLDVFQCHNSSLCLLLFSSASQQKK